jgi:putative selenate reductase YgfK subunit
MLIIGSLNNCRKGDDTMSSDKFWSCEVETLLHWILEEEKQGQIFGIRKELFFTPKETDPFRLQRYGQLLETPLGVAAGPHTQLSQNLIAAWLTGARYLELKTVQVLDELEVTKPCIDMTDEGYNCEWSQELKLDQSFDEYLNAWIILHILKDKFGWGTSKELGFIFNMSVGYNLEGILSPTVQHFLDRMQNCAAEKDARIEGLAKFYPRVKDLDIPDRISDNITISTMHGCPPDEVEKIGRYFVTERQFNTTIKLNPTLLGPERLRGILNDKLGFETVVPDLAFEHDLKYTDGVALIRALLTDAEKSGVAFNIKLTNTLETANQEQNLPKNEKMVYMSGRALHPISINLAARLQAEFEGSSTANQGAGARSVFFFRRPGTRLANQPGGAELQHEDGAHHRGRAGPPGRTSREPRERGLPGRGRPHGGEGDRARHRLPTGCDRARCHATGDRRLRSLPQVAGNRREGPDHHSLGSIRRGRSSDRAGDRRGRLRHQTVQPERVAGPDPRQVA